MRRFFPWHFPDNSLTVNNISDISLTCFKFPDISRFSRHSRQVVTLQVLGGFTQRPVGQLTCTAIYESRHNCDSLQCTRHTCQTRSPSPAQINQHQKQLQLNGASQTCFFPRKLNIIILGFAENKSHHDSGIHKCMHTFFCKWQNFLHMAIALWVHEANYSNTLAHPNTGMCSWSRDHIQTYFLNVSCLGPLRLVETFRAGMRHA